MLACLAPWRSSAQEESSLPHLEDETLTSPQLQALHAKLDSSGDGRISLGEALAFAEATSWSLASKDVGLILEEIDTSKDGKIGLEEHLADLGKQVEPQTETDVRAMEVRIVLEAKKFKAADGDGDGYLDAQEMPGLFFPETSASVLAVMAAEAMERKDSDKDSKLSPFEFWEADLMGEDGSAPPSELSQEEQGVFERLDSDRDGFLSLEELHPWESGRLHTQEAMEGLFQAADQDADGHLTAEELVGARGRLASSGALYHLLEWTEHHEL